MTFTTMWFLSFPTWLKPWIVVSRKKERISEVRNWMKE